MKKSSFISMILGTVSGMLFAIGMCMALLPEWNAFKPGVIFGSVGLVLGIITIIIWRKMEHKKPIHISVKTIATIIIAIIGAITFGIGMCFCMVWNKMVIGIITGIAGIIILLTLIPFTKGVKD